MLGPGVLIAIDVVLLYTILGPLVLFAIFIVFDALNKIEKPGMKLQKQKSGKTDPALWNSREIDIYMDQF